MTGKVCLITGGTRGIGLAAADRLAERGATVVVVGRSQASCRHAVETLRRRHPGAAVDSLAADLSVQARVRELAAAFRRGYERLDVLVNNAGVIVPKRQVSADGIELTFAVNHLAPFLLTNLLLDMLTAPAHARVINVASVAHEHARAEFTDLERRGYRPYRAYATSKLANVLFTYELARRVEESGLTVNAVNPGLVRTELGRGAGPVRDLLWALTHLRYRSLSLTPQQGAETIVYLGCSPEVCGQSGGYFFESRKGQSSDASYDARLAQELWSLSERLTGLAGSHQPLASLRDHETNY